MLTMKKRVACVSISMHACGSVPKVMVLRLAAASCRRSMKFEKKDRKIMLIRVWTLADPKVL